MTSWGLHVINEHAENYKILNWKHFETLRFMLTGLTDHIARKNCHCRWILYTDRSNLMSPLFELSTFYIIMSHNNLWQTWTSNGERTLIYSRVKFCSPEFKSVVEIRNLTNHSSTNIQPLLNHHSPRWQRLNHSQPSKPELWKDKIILCLFELFDDCIFDKFAKICQFKYCRYLLITLYFSYLAPWKYLNLYFVVLA